MHTGYIPTASVKHPSIGAVVAHELGSPQSDLPSFVRVGRSGAKQSAGGGFLGVQYDPFDIQHPSAPPTNTSPTTSVERYRRRLDLLGQLEQDFASHGAARSHRSSKAI